jgi:hypothetical protein
LSLTLRDTLHVAEEGQPRTNRGADGPQVEDPAAPAALITQVDGDATLESFARDMIRQRDFSAARVVAEEMLAARSEALGCDHPATIDAAWLLGAALHGLGEISGVRRLADEMLERCRRRFGIDDPQALRWQKALADVLRTSEARASAELAEDLFARRRRILGEDHEDTLAAATSLAAALYADGDFDAARSVAEDVWERRAQAQGPDHPDSLDAAEFLSYATSLSLAGHEKRIQAARIALDTLARRERVLGYSHARTVACRDLITNLRGFMAMYDPAGVAYARLTGDDLAAAASDCVPFTLPSVVRAKGLDPASLDDPSAEANVIREANGQILDEVRRLVSRNERLTMLVCARRVSRQWIRRFLEQALNPSLDDTTMQHVESEFPQLVANIVLDCPAPPAGRRPPHTTATLVDGVRIALLCALHRVHTYILNSAVRQGTFGSPGEPSLIESYVRRSERASNVKSDVLAAARARPAEGVTGLTSRRPAGARTITLTASGDQPLTLENFLPVTISSQRDRRWIGYLSHHDTAAHLGGLPFDRWWSYWISLNAVASSWTQQYDPPARTDAGTPEERERLRICCEVQNLGMFEVIRSRLRDAVLSVRTAESFFAAEYDAFVDSLTWRAGAQKPEFVESPAVFYPSGPETMFWDLLRHGGVLPGLARRVARKRGPIGEAAGRYFEGRVHASLNDHPAVTELRPDVTIGTDTVPQQLQIDHGFVVENLLILLESKSYVKTAGYLVAHDEGFERRASKVVEVLAERDAKLRDLSFQISQEWASAAPKYALYVVCTTEVEYIPSNDPVFWLDHDRDLPRVCTLDELLDWLNHLVPAATTAHPRCVPLRTP